MRKQITKEEFITRCKNKRPELEILEYISLKEKVRVRCKTCNSEYFILARCLIYSKSKKCTLCSHRELPQNISYTNEWFLTKAKEIHGDKFEYLSLYKHARCQILMKCKTCNRTFRQRSSSHLEGYGCQICSMRKLPQNKPKEVNIFENECKIIHENLYDYFQDYKNINTKIKILCKKHNEIFYQVPYAHQRGQGCPKCSLSKGEIALCKILEKYNINYERNKKLPCCTYKDYLRFDFFLPDYSLFIEYDGILHYKPCEYYGGKVYLEEIKLKDSIKDTYCKENDIKLLRIPYIDLKNIENIIKKELNLILC